MGQLTAIQLLAGKLLENRDILVFARNIATAIVDGPKSHCAATLSALLVFAGIYPNGGGTGDGDLEPRVVTLAFDLENRRGWRRIELASPSHPAERIGSGDVGVVIVSETEHHIYLVVEASDQSEPLIADNQLSGVHRRPLAGDTAQEFSPTTYLLRAPDLGSEIRARTFVADPI